uniref:Ovule protein n=1 Tax=Ascaris lumbricoides TaxID=6252 RepID=A0A0M3IH28_ASCLU
LTQSSRSPNISSSILTSPQSIELSLSSPAPCFSYNKQLRAKH